jgi:hypothetical protein
MLFKVLHLALQVHVLRSRLISNAPTFLHFEPSHDIKYSITISQTRVSKAAVFHAAPGFILSFWTYMFNVPNCAKHMFAFPPRTNGFLQFSASAKTSLHHKGAPTMSVGFLCGSFERWIAILACTLNLDILACMRDQDILHPVHKNIRDWSIPGDVAGVGVGVVIAVLLLNLTSILERARAQQQIICWQHVWTEQHNLSMVWEPFNHKVATAGGLSTSTQRS